MLQMRTMFAGWAVVLALAAVANADYVAVDYSGTANVTSLWNTVAGGDGTNASKEDGEGVACAIDGNTGTKYLNFGYNNNPPTESLAAGINTGFHLTLASAAKVTAIQFATANDCPERDPLTITVEGSNATDALMTGSSWTKLYEGVSGLADTANRLTYGDIVGFNNSTNYTSYRVLITSKRDVQNSVQYGEVKLFTGSPIPEPSTTILGLTGAAGLLAYAWRKRR